MTTFTPIEDVLVYMPNTVYGLNLAWVSNTTFTVSAGYARDSLNMNEIILSDATTTVNVATNGLNGLDTGTIAVSSVYSVFVIGSASKRKAPGCLISLSQTAPTMPDGYDIFRRIGFVTAAVSTAYLLKFYQIGKSSYRFYQYITPISVLSGGSSTTLAQVDLSAVVPAVNNTPVLISTSFTPNAAADTGFISPDATGTGVSFNANVAHVASSRTLNTFSTLVSAAPSIYYSVTASGALSVSVVGFTDCL